MILYHYHQTTGEYLGQSTARISPLEPGQFLISANSTTAPPPITQKGEAAVFSNDTWILLADNRGEYYDQDRAKVYVTEIGDDIPDGWTPTPRPYTQNELDAIAALSARIAAIEAAQETEGLKHYTVEQARDWIRGKIDSATTVAAVKQEIKEILLKMVPYLLK